MLSPFLFLFVFDLNLFLKSQMAFLCNKCSILIYFERQPSILTGPLLYVKKRLKPIFNGSHGFLMFLWLHVHFSLAIFKCGNWRVLYLGFFLLTLQHNNMGVQRIRRFMLCIYYVLFHVNI